MSLKLAHLEMGLDELSCDSCGKKNNDNILEGKILILCQSCVDIINKIFKKHNVDCKLVAKEWKGND